MPLSAGDRLGPYEILSAIGAGGMGEVFKARDTRLNRVVAIKRLKGDHTARFEQEARAIAALNHPHICQIYDVGPDYLVLEYVEGSPVQGPMDTADAVRVALQIAGALEVAHNKKIIHRDLKPANILMSPSGAKLLDFGLAKLLAEEDGTLTAAIAGTPLYMSPEQAEGRSLDARSDVFSFGSVLYELLAGRRAFDSLGAVLRDDPPPLGSAGLHRIVARCLRKNPTERFASASELRAALEELESKPAPRQSSIAVLPFANMSGDKEQEYFSDGLAEEIINLLVQALDLKVTARTSAFSFKGQNIDIRRIAETLGVTTVLEGSVRRAGNCIRVTAQLINAADGYHLWSERFDRELTDVFAIQDEIAAAITGALQLKLVAPRTQRHTPNMAAYEAYLKYLYYLWKFTPDAAQRVRACLEHAITLDPKFALPYVGLADDYMISASVGGMTADESMPRMRELALRALELDPELPEAHAMLGIVAAHYDFDWKECDRRFALAMARERVSAFLQQKHSLFILLCGDQLDAARRNLERVIEQDPLCQMWHYSLAIVLQSLGLTGESIAAGRKSVDLDPEFWVGWWWLGMIYAIDGRHAEARACAEKALAGAPWSPLSIGLMAGEAEDAAALLGKLRADAYRGPVGLFCYYMVRGEIDSAVEELIRAVENRFPMVIIYGVSAFRPLLRQSPGWPTLLKKMNRPESS